MSRVLLTASGGGGGGGLLSVNISHGVEETSRGVIVWESFWDIGQIFGRFPSSFEAAVAQRAAFLPGTAGQFDAWLSTKLFAAE